MSVNSKKMRILISDDNRIMRELIKSFYVEYDFECIEAVNGQQAVEMARTCSPDLILLDIGMPVMNGYEAAAILKNDDAAKAIPILVITGQECKDVAKQMRGMHHGYLGKPFKKAELLQATMQFLPTIAATKKA